MDNGTMVEAFKFLNYYQLATNSLVSKRYRNLIRTHRHKLALLDVDRIYMYRYVANQDTVVIEIFEKEFSSEEYNEWIVSNGYSKVVPLEGRIAGKECKGNDRDMYEFWAEVYPDPNNRHDIATTVLYARTELKDETWPLFQHFIRLLMDPFIYIRYLRLNPQKEVFTLLAGAMNPDRHRLQCKQLNICINVDTPRLIVWMKDHVHCDEFGIYGHKDSNCDEELADLFMTGSTCTSVINVMNYDLSNVIVDLVQKFTGLKNRDECQVVESIRGNGEDRGIVEALKRNFTEFIAEEEKYEGRRNTGQIIGFINHDIEKELTFNAKNNYLYGWPYFSITITNL
ncbi:hypothetical protein DdX_20047 [Ditylenchus destructor]|uniref:F-box domain-containing protein n=1 Tax=Ditylenchus destructor TaxID=166010 RepID=A0AAD4QWR9_9BILA|nr:hypothetical protein DdX_20047 [Ditylenchus destructor]